MAKGYRPVDRDQVFLLPPDMRSWLPADHRVWFVLDVVAALDTSALHSRSKRGSVGRAGYDPDMLLGVLIYAYMTGMLSSRAVEQACHTDVAFRVLCAQDAPDHTTIARFRQNHENALAQMFSQVLLMCARAGMGSFGTVAIDGTKIAANASNNANRKRSWLRKQAEDLLKQAQKVDDTEDDKPDSDDRPGMKPGWTDPVQRAARIQQVLDEIAQQQDSRDAAAAAPRIIKAQVAVAKAERDLVQLVLDRAEQIELAWVMGPYPPGHALGPRLPAAEHGAVVKAAASLLYQRKRLAAALTSGVVPSAAVADPVGNLTDPQSRRMPTRGGVIQGYNAQLAVDANGLVLVAELTQDANDLRQFIPMMNAAQQMVDLIKQNTDHPEAIIGTILADAGYRTNNNITAPGPARLIATSTTHTIDESAEKAGPTTRSPTGPSIIGQMAIDIAANSDLYKRRAATVEPVNGHLKDRRKLRRFSRRGFNACASELRIAAWVTNLAKLHLHLTTV